MKTQDMRDLIIAAQTAEGFMQKMAINDIIIEIMQNHMHRHLAKYYKKNTVGTLDRSDMEQIFLIACTNAIQIADPFIGNPMLFILQKGKWAVSDELRKLYRRNLRQYCHCCGAETRLHERGGTPICPKCGAAGEDNIEREQFNITDDGTMSVNVMGNDKMDDMIHEDIILYQFRSKLTGKPLEVFDLIMYHGYDRDSCNNYQKEIAEKMGISQANVNTRIRQIKQTYMEYREEFFENE